MSQVMHPHMVEPDLLLDQPPVPGKVGRTGTGFGATRDPGNAVDLLYAAEHFHHRPGQRNYARARLGIEQAQHPRRAVDIVPFQGKDIVRPAAGQHEQAYRRDRRRQHRGLGVELLQRRAEALELLGRQEALAGLLAVVANMPARVAAGWHHSPVLGDGEHLGKDPHRLVGRTAGVAQLVAKRRDVAGRDVLERLRAQGRQDVVL